MCIKLIVQSQHMDISTNHGMYEVIKSTAVFFKVLLHSKIGSVNLKFNSN